MKLILLLTSLAIATFSCNNKSVKLSEVKVNELRTHFVELLKDYDSTAKLDSFRFIRLDTITPKIIYNVLFNSITKKHEYDMKILKSDLDIYKSQVQMLRISAGLSKSLFQTYKEETDDQNKKIQTRLHNDSLLELDMKNINDLMAKADSQTLKYYQAVVLYQYKRKDMSVKKDTGYVYLNLDKNIIRVEDFNKLTEAIYPMKGSLKTDD